MAHELYNQLQQAYDYFNQALFSGRLPPCLITVQRENENIHGYYSQERFGSKKNGQKSMDEIAMNPIYFVNSRIENVLSTLAHEMTHLEQAHFGKPGRGRYHNKEWGDLMEQIGLMPSNTCKVGGHRTGDQMAHYIVKDGRFDQVCKKLIDNQFQISWYDQKIHFSPSCIQQMALEPVNYGERIPVESIIKTDRDKEGTDTGNTPSDEPEAITRLKKKLKNNIEGVSEPDTSEDEDSPIKPVASKKKTVYQCPNCKAKVWGRPGLEIYCKRCEQDYVEK